MIKAIFFYLGGVIYRHPKEVIEETLKKVYKHSNKIVQIEYRKYKRIYLRGMITTDKLINLLSISTKTKYSNSYIKKLWIEYYGEFAKPNQNILKIISSLKESYKVYLFSNTAKMSDM